MTQEELVIYEEIDNMMSGMSYRQLKEVAKNLFIRIEVNYAHERQKLLPEWILPE